ncbi:MAG: YARHG domain-containing protein [Clostridiales bacterium]|nr:YARHG domain-containing protein [Clostridiales bacterium]
MKEKLLMVLLALCVAVFAIPDVFLMVELNRSSKIGSYSEKQSEDQDSIPSGNEDEDEIEENVIQSSMDGFLVSRSGVSGKNEEENGENDDADYILPDSDKKYYKKEDLESLTREEVKLARNEIYARHGRIFKKDMKVKEYFESKDWYKGTVDEVSDSELNKYEIANRDLIVKYEEEKNWK